MADYELSIDALSRQMTELQTMDATRLSRDPNMPPIGDSHRFDVLATKISGCTRDTPNERNREMTAFFGCPPIVMAKLWGLVHLHETITPKAKTKHLLWGLHYLGEYPGQAPMCKNMAMPGETKPDDKTLREWSWIAIEAIADLRDGVALWENREKLDRGNDCLIGVDCKDCRFQQMLVPNPDKPGKMVINKSLNSSSFVKICF